MEQLTRFSNITQGKMDNLSEPVSLSILENAVASIDKALSRPITDDLLRDGVIQRFEYTFELCWKTIRKFLIAMGRKEVSASPRPILRDAFEEHFIEKRFLIRRFGFNTISPSPPTDPAPLSPLFSGSFHHRSSHI